MNTKHQCPRGNRIASCRVQGVHLLRRSGAGNRIASCRVQGVHLLRRSDVPLAAVDNHNSRLLGALMADDAILAAVLAIPGPHGGQEDPQTTLGHLL